LNNQDRLIKTGEKLQDQLNSAREEVSEAFTSIQQQAWSFKEQFNEVDKITNLLLIIMNYWHRYLCHYLMD